jgi:hypothetical protein
MQIEQEAFDVRGQPVAFLFEPFDFLGEGLEEDVLDFDASAQLEDVLSELEVVDRDGWVVGRVDRGD